MGTELIVIGANIVVVFAYLRCLCSILHMRSQVLLYVLISAFTVAGFVTARTEAPPLIRLLCGSLASVVVPIALATDPFRTRVVRTGMAWIALASGDAMGPMASSLIFRTPISMSSEVLSQGDVAPTVATYGVALVTAAFCFEAVIALCSHLDHRNDEAALSLALMPLIISGFSYAFFLYPQFIASGKFPSDKATSFFYATSCFLNVSTLILAWAILAVTHRDMQASQSATDGFASLRLAKHARGEVEASMQRSRTMRMLRHDLANQIETVQELAEQGHTDEADRYLEALQTQAHRLAGKDT